MIRHYRSDQGISGYAEGDIMVDTMTGATSRAVRDGRGIVLEPTVADIAFGEAEDVTRIGLRLAPIDVGFDLRAEDMAVDVRAGETIRASYATRDGDRRVISGPRAEVLKRLRRHGYRFIGGGAP